MKSMTVDISALSQGYAEVIDSAGNGSWATIEFIEYSRTGNARRRLRVTVDTWSLAYLAGRALRLIKRQREDLDRMERVAKDEGY